MTCGLKRLRARIGWLNLRKDAHEFGPPLSMANAIGRLGLACLCVSLWACGPGERDLPPRGNLVGPRHQVVFVTVDTLRASHLGCYGYHRDTSPFIDSLAREGVQLMHVFAPVP